MGPGHSKATDEVRVVRGRPTAEELAAVLAAVKVARRLARRGAARPSAGVRSDERQRYERWRAGRLAALRADPRRPARFRRG